jgi:hypothetical protein
VRLLENVDEQIGKKHKRNEKKEQDFGGENPRPAR